MATAGSPEGLLSASETRLDSGSRRWIQDRSSVDGLTARRVEAFSDAVLAIAITLLVLQLGPASGQGSLSHRLGEHWPLYVAYLLSFLNTIWSPTSAVAMDGAIMISFLLRRLARATGWLTQRRRCAAVE